MKYWIFKDKTISLEYFTNVQLHKDYKRIDICFSGNEAISISYETKDASEEAYKEFLLALIKSEQQQ